MTEHAPDRVWSGIDIPKTLAGALAAVCAAVIGSFLGVAGTLIGAAVASIIGSIGTEIWHRSIRKGTQHLQTTLAPAFVKAPAAVGTPEVAAASEEDSPSHTTAGEPEPAAGGEPAPKRQIRWKPILVSAALLFFISMGAILAIETFAGQSIASITGNGSKGGTTLSHIISGDTKTDSTPTPTVSTTPATAPSAGDGSQPGAGSSTAPGNVSSEAPTTAPTTGAPAADTPTTGATAPGDGTQQDGGQPQDQQIVPDSGGDNAQ